MTDRPKTSPWTVALLAALAAALVMPIRRAITRWGATDEELRAIWPGDRLVDRPKFTWTSALTINRPAHAVWPWLVQLGQGRGGLYSYDWLENLVGCGVHSTDRVIPENCRCRWTSQIV
jgi:hypothetical protein